MRRAALIACLLSSGSLAARAQAQDAEIGTEQPEAAAPTAIEADTATETKAATEATSDAVTDAPTATVPDTATDASTETAPSSETSTETGAAADSAAEPDAEQPTDDADRHHGGIGLPGDFRLHGIFDLAYERIDYSDDLGAGRDALRNYHHFVFLRREARDDPFGIDVELVDLTFYEIQVRFTDSIDPWRVSAKLGKILVPFGDEPLFHHAYGGQTGFDQQFVPFVWARHGGSARVQGRIGDVSLQNDAYLVQGHVLEASDQVIDLQTDFSSSDDTRWAYGDRIGIGYDAFSVWYSIYYNRLRFDRQLLLQALDLGLWRLRDVPVLEDMVISVGVARADVSGGTWTEDRVPLEHYYHFADYVQLQYYLTEWLEIEGRTGLVTTNNRDGVYRDGDRDDVTDVQAYVLGVTARYGGFSASLHHHWRIEAVDEQDDDLLRLRLAYAF